MTGHSLSTRAAGKWIVVAVGLAVTTSCTTSPTPGAGPATTQSGASATSHAVKSGTATPASGKPPTTPPATTQPPATQPPVTTAGSGRHPRVRTVGALPYPLSRMATATDGARVLLLGGLKNKGSSGDVFAFDPPSRTVRRLGGLEKAVHDTAAAVLGDTVLLVGGGAATESSDVQALLASGATVRRGTLPAPRSDLNAVTIGETLYVVGGYTGAAELPDVLATTDGVHFRVVGALPVTVRYAAVVAVGTDIWVIGGDHHRTPTDAVQRIDTLTGKVSLVGHLRHALGHASAWRAADGSVLVAGGTLTNSTRTDAISRFDRTSLSMTRIAALPHRMSDMGVAVVGAVAYLFGGETGSRLTSILSVG